MKNERFNVRPIAPLAGYVGGKRILSKMLVPMINTIPHGLYCEPFTGMGGVFFRRTERPAVEVINDRSKDVANFFRIVQRHHQAFLDMLKWQVASRSEFERLPGQNPDTLTDLERAARFLYLQKMTFGGKVTGRSFGISTSSSAKFDMTKLVPMLEAAHERLNGVYIECLRWQDFLSRWDRPNSLHFVDPPYYGTEDYYGKDQFPRVEFEELAATLRTIKGKFILTLNDVPEIREMFAWAKIEAVGLTYSAGGKPTEAREVIITPD